MARLGYISSVHAAFYTDLMNKVHICHGEIYYSKRVSVELLKKIGPTVLGEHEEGHYILELLVRKRAQITEPLSAVEGCPRVIHISIPGNWPALRGGNSEKGRTKKGLLSLRERHLRSDKWHATNKGCSRVMSF